MDKKTPATKVPLTVILKKGKKRNRTRINYVQDMRVAMSNELIEIHILSGMTADRVRLEAQGYRRLLTNETC